MAAAKTRQNLTATVDEDKDIVYTVTTGGKFTVVEASAANPIAIDTEEAHGLTTGDYVKITGVRGNETANVTANAVTVTDVNSFTLNSVDGSSESAYTGGGVVEPTINLTGFSAEWSMRTHPLSSNDVLNKTTSSGIALTTPTGGVLTVTIADSDTASIEPRVYYHELEIVTAGGLKTTACTGTLNLQPSAT